jgi:PAS domain S-box-containing protein
MMEGGGFTDQFRIVRPDGGIRTLEERGEVIKDRTGAPLLMAGTTQDVTQRIQAEQDLAAKEFFLRRAQEAGGVGVWQRNLTNGEIVWSEQTYHIFGLIPDHEEVTKEQLFAAIHPDDRARFISVRQQAGASQSGFNEDFRVVWPTGEIRHVESSAETMREPSGAVVMRGTVQDVTRRKVAEESLRAGEARIRGIVETIPHGIQESDLHGVIMYSNRAHTQMLGYANGELIGRTLWSLGASPAEQNALREYFQSLAEQQPAPAPYHGVDVTKDGRRIDVQVDWDYLRDAQGRLTGFISIITDTTERRRAETQLRESEERYRSLVEGSTQGILISQDGKIVFCNQEIARRVANGDTGAVLGKPALDLIVPEDRERVVALRSALLAGEAVTFPVEYRVAGSNGEVISVQAYSQQVLWQGRPAIQSTLTDVTATRELERQLAQSQRLETVGRLAGGIAHDFNNILTVISAYIGFILDRAKDNAQLQEDATVVQDASRRAAALTRQLLAFSRRQILQMRVISLNDVVTGMHTMLGRVIGEDIVVRVALDPALKPVRADASQVDQVLMNLVINARDAMPRGGILSIETENQSLDEHYARMHTDVAPGEYVMLAITDSGTGMAPETQKRIFEPFFTTKPQGQGTGLGLATVYGIVKQMNGSIFVYSELNKGTTFKIYFPVALDAAINGALESAKPPTVQPTETILLVEDDELVRRSAQRILQGGGYRVIVATSPEEALAIAKAGDQSFDLLLTDVVMPGLSGGELWETIRKVRDVRVLFMSGYTDDMIVRHVVLEGEMPFISKPFTKQSLLDKVREVFGQGR